MATLVKVIVSAETSHTGSTAGTTAGALVVSRQSVAPRKFAATLFADVRPLPGVEFGVPFKVVETAKS
jgi:hypothetical protein